MTEENGSSGTEIYPNDTGTLLSLRVIRISLVTEDVLSPQYVGCP